MNEQIIDTYCVCDEITKLLGIKDDAQCRMTNAEIITFAIYSAFYLSLYDAEVFSFDLVTSPSNFRRSSISLPKSRSS